MEALLKERINYNTLIEGMLSEQSMDVSYVIDNVVQGIMANGISAYIDEFNFILDRANDITSSGLFFYCPFTKNNGNALKNSSLFGLSIIFMKLQSF